MKYNFDEIVDRRNTNCLKYDFAAKRNYPEDILPLWVADMDFRTAREVVERLVCAAQHGIFGYTDTLEDYFQAVFQWFYRRFGWETKEEWLVKTPGVVYAIATAIRALTKEGDGVMLQNPVYYPFTEVILSNRRRLVNNALRYENGRYTIDFEDMEEKMKKEKVKMFLLCSPHNPVGRVWTEEELRKVGELCRKYHVFVVADEIHCDFTYEGYRHFPFGSLSEEFAANAIICTAPSKTFNLAGLQVSNIFIAEEGIRKKFCQEMSAGGYSQLNTMGLAAAQAAYLYGEEWLTQLKDYLQGNMEYMQEFLKDQMPEVRLVKPEGTYLTWVDCSGLGLSDRELNQRIVHQAKLWLDAGNIFGKEGRNFQRFNIACPRKILELALERFASVS